MSKKTGNDSPNKAKSRKAAAVRKSASTTRRRTRMIALEPRMLFDGALAVDLATAASATPAVDAKVADASTAAPATDAAHAPVSAEIANAVAVPASDIRTAEKPAGDVRDQAGIAAPDGAQAHEILIIDGALTSDVIAQIVAATRSDVEIHILDASKDGVQQISDILASHDKVDALHIVSHGGPGEIKLGTAVLNIDTLDQRSAEVAGWGTHLDKGADLLLYGCDVAAGQMGAAYIDRLAQVTGADIAASTDITGSFQYGGDWTLEASTGTIGASTFGDVNFLATAQIELANTAPVLNATFSPTMTAELEDAGAPSGAVGTLVSSMVGLGSNVSDPDVNAKTGIAVVGTDSANGTWYYSTNNGTSWSALGSVSTASARLLAADANTRVYFQPGANWNGTIPDALTFRAWDQTTGANGGTADTSTNGAATAFSSATETSTLNVLSVNDAPTSAATSVSIAQAGSYIFKSSDFPFT
ncbi:MAG: DUF4347 domain-containing protein, partial [Clostridia bacterium]